MGKEKPIYKRVLIKISGEALAGEKKTGYDWDIIKDVCTVVKDIVDNGVEVGIVVGGGNFWRGVKDGSGKMDRFRADQMGMLATVMNSLALSDMFNQIGADNRVMSSVEMNSIAEQYTILRADKHLSSGKIAIFGCGTGSPYFSTDTAAVLRAAEIEADAILLAKNIDGVYDDDPAKNPNAKKYLSVSYDEVLAKHLAVMDSTATSLAYDNNIPTVVFALKDPQNIKRVVFGEKVGTTVTK